MLSDSNQMVGFQGNNICLEEWWDPHTHKRDYVPWELLPVPQGHPFAAPGRFYLINRWREHEGEGRVLRMMGYRCESYINLV